MSGNFSQGHTAKSDRSSEISRAFWYNYTVSPPVHHSALILKPQMIRASQSNEFERMITFNESRFRTKHESTTFY